MVFAYRILMKMSFVVSIFSLSYMLAADFKNELLYNSQMVLDSLRATRSEFCSSLQNTMNEEVIKQIIIKHEMKNPIFMLTECNSINNSCVFYRKNNSMVRNIFESAMVDVLIQKNDVSTAPVHYVSFASGGMFQDFVVMAKFLQQRPQASIVIHMIDILYKKYTLYCTLVGATNEVTIEKNVCCRNNLDRVLQQNPDIIEQSNAFIVNANFESIISELPAQQFLKEIKNLFPMSNVRIILHASTDDYFTYIKKYKVPYADVIGAIDFQDDQSCKNQASYFFIKLCAQSVQKNSLAKIVAFVAPNTYNDVPCLYVKQ